MIEFSVFLDKKLIKKTLITKSRISVGRSPDNDLVLQDQHVSRLHLIIQGEGDLFRIEDKSANGIILNDRKLEGSGLLPRQCRLEIFPFVIHCTYHGEDKTIPISKKDIIPVEGPAGSTSPPSPPTTTTSFHFGTLIGESPEIKRVYRLIEDVASSRATVLIRGEHGTGKELVAKAIHNISQRKEHPLITLNCAAIPNDLIESELFGHEKGAFTGALERQKGKVEAAKGGTLFLDEIGELSQAGQAKLLRFLQDRSFMRLGSGKETRVDVRIVAATNKDLERAVREERFRADLYYRIKVVQILLPPLRERPEDTRLLAAHFIQRFTNELALSPIPLITQGAMAWLQSAEWPGNIRQLENTLYSAIVRSKPPYVLDEDDLITDTPTLNGVLETTEPPLEAISRQLLLQTLKEKEWDTTKTAATLKVSRGTIYYRMKKYGIDPREFSKKPRP